MFKKSLLALALAGTTVLSANAATLTGGVDTVVSAQGVANETVATSADVVFTFVDAADVNGLSVNDELILTLSGGSFGLGTNISAVFADVSGGGDDIDLTADTTYVTGNTATIVLGAITGAIVATDTITISGIVFNAETLAASGEITGTVSLVDATTSQTIATVTETLAETADQFSVEVGAGLSETIEVSEARLEFAAAATTDDLTLTVSEGANGTALSLATPTTVTYTVSADRGFGYLDTDADGEKDLDVTATSTVGADDTFAVTFAADDSTFSVVQTVVGTLDTDPTITIPGGDGETIINRDSFAVDSTVFSYTPLSGAAATFAGATGLNAGEWTINGGSIVTIAGLPFGTSFSQYVTISNITGTAGVAELVAFVDGVSSTHTLTTAIAANGVTNLTTEIKALAKTQGWTTSNVSFEIVVTVEDGIAANALYYVKSDGDRQDVSVSVQP